MKKLTKRIISVSLIAGLVCPCFGDINSKVLAESEVKTNEVFEDFDKIAVNTTFVQGHGAVVADPADEENRVWKIENTTSGKTTLMTNLKPSTFLTGIPEEKTGKLTYEYKVYIPASNPKDGTGYYPIVNNLKQYEGMTIGNVRPNTVFRSDWQQAAKIENGFDNWFLVEYVFDYSTMTFDAYAQGKQFEFATSFKENLPTNKQYFDPVEGLHLRAYVPSGFKYYIDDLKVSYSDEEIEEEINQLITGISVRAVKIDNFSKDNASYEIELSEDDYNALTKDDVLVSLLSDHSDVVPEITVGNDENNTKTITIKAEKGKYSETFTVLCKKEEKEVLLPSEENNTYITEDFSDDAVDFITGSGEVSENPVNASDKAWKIENTGSGMTTLMTNIKPLSKMALPETKLGKLIYEYDVLFPKSNPLDKGGYYSAGVQIKQYEGMGIGTFRPINAFYDSKNLISINAGPDKWYRIRYIFDYETETFDAYAEGKLIADDISFKDNLPTNKKYFDPAEGLHLRAYVPAGFTYYIDNVNVSYVEVTPDFVKGLKTYDGEEYNDVTDFSADNYSYDAKVYGEYFAGLGNLENLVMVELEEGYEGAEIEIAEGKEKDGVKPVTVIVSKPPYMKVYTVNYSTKLRPFYSGTLQENFDGKTPENLEKFVSRTGGGTTEIVADDEAHGDALKVTETDFANNYYFNIDATSLKPNGSENAKLIYEFDFKIDDKYKTLPSENKGETTPVSVKFASAAVAHLRWFQIGVGSLAYKFNNSAEPSEYEWESIKIEIDCDTKEFKYYFDGETVPVITAINDNLSFDDLFKLQLQWWNGTKTLADVYIDNVKASYVVSHPEMIDEILVCGAKLEEFDNKNYIYNMDVYEDLYETLTEENVDVLLNSEYTDTEVTTTVTTTEDMKVVNIFLKNGLYEVNYTINCFSELRPATLTLDDVVSNEYSISFEGYIEDELGNPVSRDITAIAYKKGEEAIGDSTQYFGVTTSEKDGKIAGDILVFDTEESPEKYEMEILLDAYRIDAPVKDTVLYVNNSQLKTSVDWLKASDEDVLTYMTTEDVENKVTAEENIEIFNRLKVWVGEYLESDKKEDIKKIADNYKQQLTTENIAEYINGSVMAVLLKDAALKTAHSLISEYDNSTKKIQISNESFGELKKAEQEWVTKNLLSRCEDDEFESAEEVISQIKTSMLLRKINNTAYTALEKTLLDNEDILDEGALDALKEQSSSKVKDKAMKILVNQIAKSEFEETKDFLDALDDALEQAENSKSDSGSAGGSSGGGGSAGGKTSPVALGGSVVNVTEPTVPTTEVFIDLGGFAWAKDAILNLNEKGIVSGVGNGKFEPGRTITREEFSKLLCETFGYEKTEQDCHFEDVLPGSWYEGYVMSAYNQGIIYGVSDTLFGSGQNITRQDMVTMMYRALVKYGATFADTDTEFTDSSDISEYAKEAVFKMAAEKIVNGVGEGIFSPKTNATRAEAAVIISRVIDTFLK